MNTLERQYRYRINSWKISYIMSMTEIHRTQHLIGNSFNHRFRNTKFERYNLSDIPLKQTDHSHNVFKCTAIRRLSLIVIAVEFERKTFHSSPFIRKVCLSKSNADDESLFLFFSCSNYDNHRKKIFFLIYADTLSG